MGRLFVRNIEVAVSENIVPSFNYNILDITNPSAKQANYSKTIKIPASKEINEVFDRIFDLGTSLSTFNPNKKEPAIYFSNESEVFNGHLKLVSIDKNLANDTCFYNVELYGELSTLFKDIGEKLVVGNENPSDDIDFSEWNHELNFTNVTNSWATSNIKSGVAVGLVGGEGYRYFLGDYGKDSEFFLSQGGGYDQEKQFSVQNMKPLFFRYEMLKKIFTKAGWAWDSNFFEGNLFKKIAHPTNVEKIMLTQTQIDNNKFYVNDNTTPSNTISLVLIAGTQMLLPASITPPYPIIHNNETAPPFYDTGGNNNTTTGKFITPLQASYLVTYQCNVRIQKNTSNPALAGLVSCDGYVRISLEKEVSLGVWSTVYYEDQVFQVTGLNIEQPFQITTEVYDAPSTTYRIVVSLADTMIYWSMSMTSGSVGVLVKDSYLYVRLKSNEVVDGSGVAYDFNQILPRNKKQKDYLIDSIREFNLWMTQSKTLDKTMIIEPYEDWFTNQSEDWTEIRDIAKGEIHKPMASLENLTYLFKAKEDSDYYNKKYTDDTREVYGQADEDIDNDFLKGEKVTELSYSPTVSVGHETNGLIIPKILTYDNGVIKPIKHNTRSLLWGGVITMDGGFWQLFSNSAGVTTYNKFPYLGHLDHPYNPTFDFLFDNPQQIYWERPNLVYTDNNLYNVYWRPFINQITDKNSRVVERYYYLSERRIRELNYRKRIFDDGHYYILTKIDEFRADSDQSVRCELLKLIDYSPFVSSGNVSLDPSNTGSGSMGSSRIASTVSNFLEESATPSGMRLAGNLKTKFVTIESDSVLPKEFFTIIKADATAGDVTITLEDTGFRFLITKVDSTANRVILVSNDATGEVNFASSYSLTGQGQTVEVIPDGINFYVSDGSTSAGGGLAESFETVNQNIKSWDAVYNYTGSTLDSIDYTAPGLTITKTFNYTGSDLTSIVLSGDTPGGIELTKTFTYSGGNLTTTIYT
mgnify:FL=1